MTIVVSSSTPPALSAIYQHKRITHPTSAPHWVDSPLLMAAIVLAVAVAALDGRG
jgi:hypothetical protein